MLLLYVLRYLCESNTEFIELAKRKQFASGLPVGQNDMCRFVNWAEDLGDSIPTNSQRTLNIMRNINGNEIRKCYGVNECAPICNNPLRAPQDCFRIGCSNSNKFISPSNNNQERTSFSNINPSVDNNTPKFIQRTPCGNSLKKNNKCESNLEIPSKNECPTKNNTLILTQLNEKDCNNKANTFKNTTSLNNLAKSLSTPSENLNCNQITNSNMSNNSGSSLIVERPAQPGLNINDKTTSNCKTDLTGESDESKNKGSQNLSKSNFNESNTLTIFQIPPKSNNNSELKDSHSEISDSKCKTNDESGLIKKNGKTRLIIDARDFKKVNIVPEDKKLEENNIKPPGNSKLDTTKEKNMNMLNDNPLNTKIDKQQEVLLQIKESLEAIRKDKSPSNQKKDKCDKENPKRLTEEQDNMTPTKRDCETSNKNIQPPTSKFNSTHINNSSTPENPIVIDVPILIQPFFAGNNSSNSNISSKSNDDSELVFDEQNNRYIEIHKKAPAKSQTVTVVNTLVVTVTRDISVNTDGISSSDLRKVEKKVNLFKRKLNKRLESNEEAYQNVIQLLHENNAQIKDVKEKSNEIINNVQNTVNSLKSPIVYIGNPVLGNEGRNRTHKIKSDAISEPSECSDENIAKTIPNKIPKDIRSAKDKKTDQESLKRDQRDEESEHQKTHNEDNIVEKNKKGMEPEEHLSNELSNKEDISLLKLEDIEHNEVPEIKTTITQLKVDSQINNSTSTQPLVQKPPTTIINRSQGDLKEMSQDDLNNESLQKLIELISKKKVRIKYEDNTLAHKNEFSKNPELDISKTSINTIKEVPEKSITKTPCVSKIIEVSTPYEKSEQNKDSNLQESPFVDIINILFGKQEKSNLLSERKLENTHVFKTVSIINDPSININYDKEDSDTKGTSKESSFEKLYNIISNGNYTKKELEDILNLIETRKNKIDYVKKVDNRTKVMKVLKEESNDSESNDEKNDNNSNDRISEQVSKEIHIDSISTIRNVTDDNAHQIEFNKTSKDNTIPKKSARVNNILSLILNKPLSKDVTTVKDLEEIKTETRSKKSPTKPNISARVSFVLKRHESPKASDGNKDPNAKSNDSDEEFKQPPRLIVPKKDDSNDNSSVNELSPHSLTIETTSITVTQENTVTSSIFLTETFTKNMTKTIQQPISITSVKSIPPKVESTTTNSIPEVAVIDLTGPIEKKIINLIRSGQFNTGSKSKNAKSIFILSPSKKSFSPKALTLPKVPVVETTVKSRPEYEIIDMNRLRPENINNNELNRQLENYRANYPEFFRNEYIVEKSGNKSDSEEKIIKSQENSVFVNTNSPFLNKENSHKNMQDKNTSIPGKNKVIPADPNEDSQDEDRIFKNNKLQNHRVSSNNFNTSSFGLPENKIDTINNIFTTQDKISNSPSTLLQFPEKSFTTTHLNEYNTIKTSPNSNNDLKKDLSETTLQENIDNKFPRTKIFELNDSIKIETNNKKETVYEINKDYQNIENDKESSKKNDKNKMVEKPRKRIKYAEITLEKNENGIKQDVQIEIPIDKLQNMLEKIKQ